MPSARSFTFLDWLLFLVILAAGIGVRYWYVTEYALAPAGEGTPAPALRQVQSPSVDPIKPAGPTHVFFRDFLDKLVEDQLHGRFTTEEVNRWLQIGLGGLTAALCYALAWRAFGGSPVVGLFAGVFYVLSPLAIINVAELQDGVVTSFVMMLALVTGARAGQKGGALTSFVYGLSLAGLVLLRLTLLPFAFVGILWFMLRSRRISLGWLCALLAFLGFGLGVAQWIVKNYQEAQDPLPIVDTTWWHLWVGNNPKATGGPITGDLKDVVGEDRLKQLESDTADKEVHKHQLLTDEVVKEITSHPLQTFERRLAAAGRFFTGLSTWNEAQSIVANAPTSDVEADRSAFFQKLLEPGTIFYVTYGTLILALLGWRWSYGWHRSSMPLQLALIWAPLPYVIGHAELLHGPRLPLDGPLYCLAALALACVIPGIGNRLLRGETAVATEESEPAKP